VKEFNTSNLTLEPNYWKRIILKQLLGVWYQPN